MVASDATVVTYRFERWRAVSSGILETAGTTFLLIVALRHYHAGAVAKALIAGSGSVGLLLSPLVVSLVTSRGWRTSRAAAGVLTVGSAAFLLASMVHYLPVYVSCCLVAMASSAAGIPLMTQIYQENYPEKKRGRFFSRTVMIRIATAATFSQVAGAAFTDARLSYFPILLCIFSAALAFGAWCLYRCPSRPLTHAGGTHPLRALRFVKADKLFRHTLVCWMLMGFGNLMMLPLRVEYLANPKYGLALPVAAVALYTGVIPNMARLIMSPVWGWLFDHMNFFLMRVVLNMGFAIGILSFFLSDSATGMALGALIFGISNAGGDVAWSLWVTKFAPPDRVADYMSVHTFFTGIRGVLAPLAAFLLAKTLSLGWLAAFCGGLIVVSSLMLLPEVTWGKKGRKGSALVEEVSE